MLVQRAEEFARLIHRNQSYGELPYAEHLKEVYLTLLDFGVKDKTILAASWLHDSIEDTDTTYEILEIQFDKEVADLVLAVTNEKGINRKEILEKTAPKIRNNEKALILKLADRIVNTEFSIDNNEKLYKMYEKEFPRFKELLYSKVSTKYFIPMLWEHLENLYSNTESNELEANKYEKDANYLEWRMNEISDKKERDKLEKEDRYWNSYYQFLDAGHNI